MTLLTRIIRTSCLLLGLLWLEPIESGSEAEDTHEAGGGLLVAGRHRPPLFQPRPEPLHVVAIGVNPLWAGDRSFILLGRDRRTRAQAPDVLAKGVAAQASVRRHHPLWHAGQALQERNGL